MAKHKKKHGPAEIVRLIFLGLLGLGLTIIMLLQGTNVALFNPKGLIAEQQLNLGLITMALLLAISVPTLTLLYIFAWKYRESNTKATYNPETRSSKSFVLSMWVVPAVFVLVLALVINPNTTRLDPKKAIAPEIKPLTIQVVAMRWKWLFIYPEQNIATVNYIKIPVDRPVRFDLTADEAPMNSFWIPNLGGQLYAMTGHVNRLNLMAEEPGEYPGSSAEISGRGFAGMKFMVSATSDASFERWVQDMQLSSKPLDSSEYEELLKPSEDNPATSYSPVQSDLYAKMLMKYMGTPHGKSGSHGSSEH